MNRYVSSFMIASLLFSSLLASVFYVSELNPLTKSAKEIKKDQHRVQISFVTPETPKEEVKKVVKKKPKELKKEPKKVVKQTIKKTKPVPKKVITKKKIEVVKEKVVEKKIEKIVKKNIKKPTKNIAPKQTLTKLVKKSDTNIQSKNIKKLQNQYFASLQEKINENKTYPKRARIRNIEDDIKVEFMISPKGELLSFKIIEGRKLFYRSTKKAIEDCFPFSTPIGILSKNTTVKLTLAYRLY